MAPRRLLRVRAVSRQDGLSLVEVMVTLGILAAATALIIATAPKQDPLRVEASKLEQQLSRLEALAEASGAPTGLAVRADGYEAVRWQAGTWQPLPGGARALPRGLELAAIERPRAETLPAIIFDPLGHSIVPPLTLRGANGVVTVDTPGAGSGAR